MRGGRFLRLRTSILDSSLLLEELPTRWLFVTMLIIGDDAGTGEVDMPDERLASQAGLSLAQTKRALKTLNDSDPNSRSQEEEGRRIVPLDRGPGMAPRGWRIVNWKKYRDEVARELATDRQRRHRERKGQQKAGARDGYVTVRDGRVTAGDLPEAEAEAEAESNSLPPPPPHTGHKERGEGPGGEAPEASPPGDLWNRIRDELKARVDPKEFRTWFTPSRQVPSTNGTLLVHVPTRTFAEWIGSRYGVTLASIATELGFPDLEFRFVAEE